MDLRGKVALITGASRGIGRKVAELFASHGAAIIINYLESQGAAQSLGSELTTKYGSDVLLYRADVSFSNQVHNMVEAAIHEFGKIDILINNAGITRRGTLLEITEEDWDRVIQVNLKGQFLCSQSVVPYMMRQGSGIIINMASMRGIAGSNSSMNYAVSKAGVIALTKCLAIELAPTIRVNCVAPGYTLTDIHNDKTPDQIKAISNRIPLKRFALAEEIASVVLFLASEDSNYVTGETIIVSGGYVIQ